MASATFTAAVDNSTVFGNNRIVYGLVTGNAVESSFVVGLSDIFHVCVTAKSITSAFGNVTWTTASTILIGSSTSGDTYHIMAIGR